VRIVFLERPPYIGRAGQHVDPGTAHRRSLRPRQRGDRRLKFAQRLKGVDERIQLVVIDE